MEACLLWSTRNQFYALAYWFLCCWADIVQVYPEATAIIFQFAAKSNWNDAIQVLLRRGTNINAPTPRKSTALLELIARQDIEASNSLLANGADANFFSRECIFSPLGLAANLGNNEILLLLLRYGADL